MKFLLILSAILGFAGNGIYTFTITTTENQDVSLQNFSGKKIIILTVPGIINQEDSVVFKKVDSLSQAGGEGLKIIAVPRLEDGATDGHTLSDWYEQHLSNSILKSKAMMVSKTSSDQSALFNWLCSKDSNNRFEKQTVGHWDAFVINEQGELQGLINNYNAVSLRKIKQLLGL